MAFSATKIPYAQTGFFSKTVIDYLQNADKLAPFFRSAVSVSELGKSIAERVRHSTNRSALKDALHWQYQNQKPGEAVLKSIDLLEKETTFTITTAHQPNIFTGPLYFLYKILHAIELAEFCKEQFPEYDFVPVYYMGSEDADLDELGHIYLNSEKLNWDTKQTGAIGRMVVDKNLLKLIERIRGEVGVHPFGDQIISIISENYKEGVTIQEATLGIVNELFGKYGLIVLIPDNPKLKSLAKDIFREELLNGTSAKIVEETGRRLSDAGYHAQAYSREINFFYLNGDKRERFEKINGKWNVVDTDISFDEEQLKTELDTHPERFSPNVILRGIFQETILPNIAFIGGGGELAYWLQLKGIFEHYKVPYPMLILRNSFLFVADKSRKLKNKLGFSDIEIFQPTQLLQSEWVKKNSTNNLSVDAALRELNETYEQLSRQAEAIDPTLMQHTKNLSNTARKYVETLEKKMLRAEKRNQDAAMRQIEKIKDELFPNGNLQERIDNFIPYYAKWGKSFIDIIYDNSLILEQEFVVLEETS